MPYTTMWWGYNEFVLLFVTTKNTGPRPTFYYTDRLRITFGIDLTMSVCPSVCVSMYSCAQSTGHKWQHIWMKFGMVAFFGPRTIPIDFGNNRSMFRPSPHTNVPKTSNLNCHKIHIFVQIVIKMNTVGPILIIVPIQNAPRYSLKSIYRLKY